MRRFGLSMLAVAVAFGINLLAANEKPSDAMKAVMNANTAANATVRAAAKASNFATLAQVAATTRRTWRTSTPSSRTRKWTPRRRSPRAE